MKRTVPFLLVHAFEFALLLSMAVVALVFTAFPAALNHAPVGFENRGVIHHFFHYALLAGAFLALVGLVVQNARSEMVGLILLAGGLTMNLIGLITSGDEDVTGIGFALRIAVLIGVFSRLYLIAFYLPRLAKQVK